MAAFSYVMGKTTSYTKVITVRSSFTFMTAKVCRQHSQEVLQYAECPDFAVDFTLMHDEGRRVTTKENTLFLHP